MNPSEFREGLAKAAHWTNVSECTRDDCRRVAIALLNNCPELQALYVRDGKRFAKLADWLKEARP